MPLEIYLQAAPAATGSHAQVPEVGTATQQSKVPFSKGKAGAAACDLELTDAKSRRREVGIGSRSPHSREETRGSNARHTNEKASAQPGRCSTRRRSARRCWWTGHLGCLRPTGAYEPGDPRLDLHEREERTEVPRSDAQRERSISTDRILFSTRLQRAARYCSVSTLPAPVLDAQGPHKQKGAAPNILPNPNQNSEIRSQTLHRESQGSE